MKRNIMLTAGLSAVAIVASAGVASASVTVNNGVGFVGKGDVQTALGWNNATMQKNAESLRFTTTATAGQSLTSTASQSASQSLTQAVGMDVTCTVVTGKKSFHRDGERDGSRLGSRDGSRVGTRAGSLVGTLSADVAYEARKSNQFTGFNLRGYSAGPTFAASGPESFEAPTFGEWTFGADTLGEIVWGGWDAAPGENPADCLGGNPGVSDLVVSTTEGEVVGGEVVEGATEFGATQYGAVTATGPVMIFVNGVNLPVTPVL